VADDCSAVADTLLAEPVSMGADASEQDVGISRCLFLAWFECPSRWISRGRSLCPGFARKCSIRRTKRV